MAVIPQIERVTKDAALSHFFLMFGYKLYSFYFPLYLVAKSFSLPQVGYTNFFIYLPIAIFAPIAGFLNHKINPAILSAIGILGYGIHALGMLIFPNLSIFYLFQIILGISAALFFVSARAILMSSKLENYDRAFAWFYSANSYAATVAPAVGAFFIWKFGFLSVFALSFVIQIINSIFCFSGLRKHTRKLADGLAIKQSGQNYRSALSEIKKKNAFTFMGISFLLLILAGFNNTFFVLFLKNLNWSQNKILIFNSLLYLVFLPISFGIIKQVARLKSEKNISWGSQITGFFSALLGVFSAALNFYWVFFIMLGTFIGGLIADSGRSGFLSLRLKKYPEESAAIDTVFAPLATAAGSLIGGLIIVPLGYPLVFIVAGGLIFTAGTFGFLFQRKIKGLSNQKI